MQKITFYLIRNDRDGERKSVIKGKDRNCRITKI
jgi:hypothetical protein